MDPHDEQKQFHFVLRKRFRLYLLFKAGGRRKDDIVDMIAGVVIGESGKVDDGLMLKMLSVIGREFYKRVLCIDSFRFVFCDLLNILLAEWRTTT